MESELTILAIELAFGCSILANILIPIACWFLVRRGRRAAFRAGFLTIYGDSDTLSFRLDDNASIDAAIKAAKRVSKK